MHRFALCLLLTCSLWSAAAQSQPYAFTTLAGWAGTPGSADGLGNSGRFRTPTGIAVDTAGQVYVADTDNSTVRKITPDGSVSTLAGLAGTSGSADGTGNSARFRFPTYVAVDRAGNVYVADTGNNTIRRITPAGVVSTLAGQAGLFGSADGTATKATFNGPMGIAVDSADSVYVADSGNCTIRKITRNGLVGTLAGRVLDPGGADGTGNGAQFAYPYGLALDGADNLYVADSENHSIRKITPEGVVSTLAGRTQFSGTVDGVGSEARFHWPLGLAADSGANVYVSDTSNHTVRKIAPDGLVTTLAGWAGSAGSADGAGSNARFNSPRSIAVDQAANLYVADTQNHTIRFGALPPSLCLRLVANRLLLSWPLAASNYIIETSSTLLPGAAWTPLSTAVRSSGDAFVVTNTADIGARFYRLRTP